MMADGMAKKTDNHNPKAKLDLRRYFLSKYHAEISCRVLDCCQGSGLLWSTLRREFAVERYWGLDMKPKKGRLSIDSSRVLAQAGLDYDVIDIDTYGSPWKHWEALLPNIYQPVTVFLTVGMVAVGGTPLTKEAKEALGLGQIKPPNAIVAKLNGFAVGYCLARCYAYDTMAIEAVEASGAAGHARYIGVRLTPVKNEQPECQSGCPEHAQSEKETENV
jgi:hypothetical protein